MQQKIIRFRECSVRDCDGDWFSTGLTPDDNGKWVLYSDAIAEPDCLMCDRCKTNQPCPTEKATVIEKLEKAMDMVEALCKPRGTEGSRMWMMSIPARPDYDPDLVIGKALADAKRFILSGTVQDSN